MCLLTMVKTSKFEIHTHTLRVPTPAVHVCVTTSPNLHRGKREEKRGGIVIVTTGGTPALQFRKLKQTSMWRHGIGTVVSSPRYYFDHTPSQSFKTRVESNISFFC